MCCIYCNNTNAYKIALRYYSKRNIYYQVMCRSCGEKYFNIDNWEERVKRSKELLGASNGNN